MTATPAPEAWQLIGRSSSHFTRVARIFAHELGIALTLVPVFDITQADAAVFAGNPTLKLPTLRRPDGSLVFGAENICRALVDRAPTPLRIVWPESLHRDLSRNAQELVWHAMSAQVQLTFGVVINKLPADNPYFVKARASLAGALGWLDANLHPALNALPADRDLSVLEVTLFCLLEHLVFRETVSPEPYPALTDFARAFAQRPSARATPYAFDVPPKP